MRILDQAMRYLRRPDQDGDANFGAMFGEYISDFARLQQIVTVDDLVIETA
jgi:hypothetical protein